MKGQVKILFGFLLLASCKPVELKQLGLMKRRVMVHQPAVTISAELQDEGMLVLPKIENTYYWFEKGLINSSQGAYSGKVLHGQFRVYDKDSKRVLESGKFYKGLREGRWLFWNAKGLLTRSEIYHDGWLNGSTVRYDSIGKPADTLRYKSGVLVVKKKAVKDTSGLFLRIKRFFKKK